MSRQCGQATQSKLVKMAEQAQMIAALTIIRGSERSPTHCRGRSGHGFGPIVGAPKGFLASQRHILRGGQTVGRSPRLSRLASVSKMESNRKAFATV